LGGSGSSHAQTANLERARQRALDDIQAQIKAEGKIYDQQAKQKAAAIAYASGLEEQTKTRQAQLDLQLQSVGMSDREIQQAQALLQIREQYNRAVQQINSQRNAALAVNPKADVSGFDSELAAQKRNLDAQTAQQKDYYANLLELEGDWREGATRGMKQFMDSAADVAG
jgi:lambda family phage tail tape measure protein